MLSVVEDVEVSEVVPVVDMSIFLNKYRLYEYLLVQKCLCGYN